MKVATKFLGEGWFFFYHETQIHKTTSYEIKWPGGANKFSEQPIYISCGEFS